MDSRLTKADRQSYGRSISLSDLTSADGVGAAEQGLAAAPQQRLASYVSAPASTLAELRSMPLEHISEDTDAASAPAAATGSPQYATWLHRPLTSGPAMAASQAGKGVSQAAKPPLAAMSPGPRSPGAGGARSPSPNRKQLPRNLRRSNSLIARDHSSDDEEIALCAAGDGLPTKGWGDDPDLDVDPDAVRGKRPFWKRKRVWIIVAMLTVSFAFIVAGVCVLEFKAGSHTANFQVWRLFFFIAGLPFIWWGADIATRVDIWAPENSFFAEKNVIYFMYRVRKPLCNVLRAAFTLAWWAIIMMINTSSQSDAVNRTIDIILKLWACITLFMTANLLKTLLAKMMALKFNKESHLIKMTEALTKEKWLRMLLQPHQHTDDEAEGENPNPQGLAGYGGNSIQRRSRRFFSKFSVRRTASTGQMAHDPGAPRLKRNGSSLQDTFLFWRRGSAPLPSIEESESSTVELTKHGGEVDSSVRGPGANANGGENKEASSPPPVMVQIDTPVTSPKAAPATAPPADGLPLPAPVRLAPCGGTPRAGASPASARARHRLGPGGTPLAGGRGASPPSRPVSLQRTTSNVSRQSRRAERVEELANDLDQPLRRGELMAKMAKLERYIRKNELELSFKDALSRFESCDEGNETEAKRVAYYLFWNIKGDFQTPFIQASDLEPFLPEKDVGPAFEMLDVDGNGSSTIDNCVTAVEKIYAERRNLSASLRDARSISNVLETLIGILLHVIFVFFYLLIFQANIAQLWVSFSGVVLAFSFMFGNSVRQTYENVVFLFAVHPYDIGENLIVDDQLLTVDEITINFTCFTNGLGQKVWYPNQKLLGNPFINVTTSKNKGESITILVDMDTPSTTIEALETALKAYAAAQSKEIEALSVNVGSAAVPLKITISIYFRLTHPGIDGERTGRVRTAMYKRMAEEMTRLGVQYTWPPVKGLGAGPAAAAAAARAVANGGAANALPQF